jgi:hypothetical protein
LKKDVQRGRGTPVTETTNDERDLVARLNARIDELSNTLEQLQAEVARGKTQPIAAAERTTVAPPDARVDRRHVLKGAGIAAAGAAAAIVVAGHATPAGAIVNPNLILDQANNADLNTTINWNGSSGAARVLFLVNDSEFVQSDSSVRAAIAAFAGGNSGATTDTGMYGYSEAHGGTGVCGTGDSGVWGDSFGQVGVLAEGHIAARGLIARSDHSQAIWSQIASDTNTKDSVRAETAGTGSGIYATSANGSGGKFGGKTAQITLVPSTASSHPASGSAGQIFVDASKRLWYCKGGADWHQLA